MARWRLRLLGPRELQTWEVGDLRVMTYGGGGNADRNTNLRTGAGNFAPLLGANGGGGNADSNATVLGPPEVHFREVAELEL